MMNAESTKSDLKNKRKSRAFAIITVLLLAIIIWTGWGNLTIGVTHYCISSDRLPNAFDQYKIAIVSDFHNARFGNDNEPLIELVRKEKPNIIAITGDLVDSSRTDIETAVSMVKRLVEIAPCYYVTGNHEGWLGDRYQELYTALTEAGVYVFHDNVSTLEKDGETIQIAGLNDPDFYDKESPAARSDLSVKLKSIDLTEDYCILLSHRPESFNAYAHKGIDLVLSGHAHGGQFRLPFIGGLVAPNQGLFPKYDAGLYIEDRTNMIVSRGIGNSIIPVRFNTRPELVIVELNAEY